MQPDEDSQPHGGANTGCTCIFSLHILGVLTSKMADVARGLQGKEAAPPTPPCHLKPAKLKATNGQQTATPLALYCVLQDWICHVAPFRWCSAFDGSGLAFDDLGLKIQLWLLWRGREPTNSQQLTGKQTDAGRVYNDLRPLPCSMNLNWWPIWM